MVQLKSSKSLLRYPGGKSRGAKQIFDYIPKNTRAICSPFFGGGSVELMCANNGMKVYGYDKFEPLVAFWDCLIQKPDDLAQLVAGWWSTGNNGLSAKFEKRNEYQKLKDELLSPKLSKLDRAALFYVINRTSFSGSALSGGVTAGNPRFTESSIQRILDFKDVNETQNITVKHLDFRESIKKNKQKLMYLDPPYWLTSKLYGKSGDLNFQEKDHEELFKMLSKCKKWILSYNDSEKVREIYDDYEIISLEWSYGMKNYSGPKNDAKTKKSMPKSSEVLILSDGI